MPESAGNEGQKLAKAFDGAEPEPTDRQITALQTKVQDLEHKISEERFMGTLLSIILFDVIVFTSVETWTTPLVVGLFELIAVIIWADRCKVDAVLPLLDRLGGYITRNKGD